MVPLSPETQKRVERLFHGEDQQIAIRLLTLQCGDNLPYCKKLNEIDLERVRFAALKISHGNLNKLQDAIDLAQEDWRDLLVVADFAKDELAHKEWMSEQSGARD